MCLRLLVSLLLFRRYERGVAGRRVDFLKSLGGSNSVTRTFFSGILRTMLALFVHCRFCLNCLYVAIAHLMQFCFFFGVMPFRKLSVQYF